MVSKKLILLRGNCVISTVIGFSGLKLHSKGPVECDDWFVDPSNGFFIQQVVRHMIFDVTAQKGGSP